VDEVLHQFPQKGAAAKQNTALTVNAPAAPSPLQSSNVASPSSRASAAAHDKEVLDEYAVLAHVVTDKSVFRSHTVSAYLYANREIAHKVSAIAAVHTTSADTKAPPNPCLKLPEKASIKPKFHTVLLRDSTTGDKVTYKASVVGRNCKLGTKCRLNNVVLLDNVTVGENTILQNTVVGSNCTLAENCNLNDCQVEAGMSIPAGTKKKGEALTKNDVETAASDEPIL